jgi:hypothetical protein
MILAVSGAENLLDSLLHRLESDLTMTTSSLQCLRIDAALRMRASECLIPPNTGKSKIRVSFWDPILYSTHIDEVNLTARHIIRDPGSQWSRHHTRET